MNTKLKFILVAISVLLFSTSIYAKQDRPHSVGVDINAPVSSAVTDTITLTTSATTTKSILKYNVVEFETLKGQGDCLVIRDSDGTGESYVTANNGTLSISATGCGK